MSEERPRTDWEARVAKAKREGTWYGPDEEPSPYPPKEKRLRFLLGFGATIAVGVVLHPLLRWVLRRPGPVVSGDLLLDGLFNGIFPALMVGWVATRPPRPKR